MTNTILIQFLLLISLTCHAQPPSSQSIKWNISELTDLKADTVQNYESYFITYPSGKILWVQKKREDTFVVSALEENWSNVNVSGRIKYDVQIAGQSGTLVVVREEDLIEITLGLANTEGEQLEYKFKVQSFQALQP
jgi:hypothetical protein